MAGLTGGRGVGGSACFGMRGRAARGAAPVLASALFYFFPCLLNLRLFRLFRRRRLQGLNFVAGTLLLFLDEEDAFWCLAALLQDILKGYYDVDMMGMQVGGRVCVWLCVFACVLVCACVCVRVNVYGL